jgi:hypothetical protein
MTDIIHRISLWVQIRMMESMQRSATGIQQASREEAQTEALPIRLVDFFQNLRPRPKPIARMPFMGVLCFFFLAITNSSGNLVRVAALGANTEDEASFRLSRHSILANRVVETVVTTHKYRVK